MVDSTTKFHEFEKLQIFKRPNCLIDSDMNVCSETLAEIRHIDAPLNVIAIAGLYRTGKSYLMNRLAGSKAGFKLGNTIEAKTKGIWAFCKRHPKKSDHVLMLLDTEGFGCVEKGDQGHDTAMFTVTALLSNVLIYNAMSVFNAEAIEKLAFVTEMSKLITFQNANQEKSSVQIPAIMPAFVLCLRDFSLCLEKDGEEISPDEYLEHCLQSKSGHQHDRVRGCLKEYFEERKCFVFDRPTTGRNILRLEDTDDEHLSEEFKMNVQSLQNYINSVARKPTIKFVHGAVFSDIVRIYVQDIKDGRTLDVDDALMVAQKFENDRLRQDVILGFKSLLSRIKLPVLRKNDFESKCNTIREYITVHTRKFTFTSHRNGAMEEMERLLQHLIEENSKLLKEFLARDLQNKYIEIIGSPYKYTMLGGLRKYKYDMAMLKDQYKAKMDRFGVDEKEVRNGLYDFLESEMLHENEIMMSEALPSEDRTSGHKETTELIQSLAQELQQKCKDIMVQSELALQKSRATTKEHVSNTAAAFQLIQKEYIRTKTDMEDLILSIKMQKKNLEETFQESMERLAMEQPLNEEEQNESLKLLHQQTTLSSEKHGTEQKWQ